MKWERCFAVEPALHKLGNMSALELEDSSTVYKRAAVGKSSRITIAVVEVPDRLADRRLASRHQRSDRLGAVALALLTTDDDEDIAAR